MRFCLLLALYLTLARHAFAADVVNPDPALPPPMDAPAPAPTLSTPDPLSPTTASEPNKTELAAPTAPTTDASNIKPAPATPAPEIAATPSQDTNLPAPKDIIDEELERRDHKASAGEESFRRELALHEGGKLHLGMDFAYHAFAGYDFDPTAGEKTMDTDGGILQLMYSPLTHGYGRLSFGPVGGYYYTKAAQGFSGLSPSFLTYGGEIQYSMLYMLGQLFVPMILGGYEQVVIHPYINNGTTVHSDKFTRSYWGGGIAMNLNRLEQSAASHALADIGIRKFYLVLTWKVPQKVGTQGNGLLGLRFEF